MLAGMRARVALGQVLALLVRDLRAGRRLLRRLLAQRPSALPWSSLPPRSPPGPMLVSVLMAPI
jgi:hypothetical protein